jgi:hypothetical protein
MPFHWRDYENESLEDRYSSLRMESGEVILDVEAWRTFVLEVARMEGFPIGEAPPSLQERLIAAFGSLLDKIDPREARDDTIDPRKDDTAREPEVNPVVFISHQRSDIAEAEHIAHLAYDQGVDYWLDVHDPTLAVANRTISPRDARYPVLIAAIIEVALLNSTHVIAVHTGNSMSSKWVPYELGRARDRKIRSGNAAGWFHPNVHPVQFGDYVQLCRITRKEADVDAWLYGWSGGQRTPLTWGRGPTKSLPK